MKLLKGTLILKIAALICAIVTYLFISNELANESQSRTADPSYKLIKLTAKSLPVKVRFAAEPPTGYKLLIENVKIEPAKVTVIGPEALLDDAFNAETSLIDLSENTTTVTKKVPLESVAGTHLTGEAYLVEVTAPIEKIETEAKPA